MLIDIHTHLDFPQFDADRNVVIERAKSDGISIILSVINPANFERCMALSERYDNIFLTVGISPTEFDIEKIEAAIKIIKRHKEKIIGIGEVGLDYYWVKEKEKHDVQKENFMRFIELSNEIDLPLVVHSRNSEADCIDILKKEDMPAILHCFSGTTEEANDAIAFGCVISIPTSVVYSKQKQDLVRKIPLESIVLETDAPYLSPVPKTRNEPSNIRRSAEKIAQIKGIKASEVEEVTTKNASQFFKINFLTSASKY